MGKVAGTIKVAGIGINDSLTKVAGNPVYAQWTNILHQIKLKPSEYSICDEWKYFSKFAEWVSKQNKLEKYRLDTNWLSCNTSKRHFSPETAVFIPATLSHLFLVPSNRDVRLPLGVVAFKRGFMLPGGVRQRSGAPGTLFATPLDAHIEYLIAKRSTLLKVRDTYVLDERLDIMIALVLDVLEDHINTRTELKNLSDLFN